MKVLFIGGTGIISSACSELAIEKGMDLYHFNRGITPIKVNGVTTIQGDIRDFYKTRDALKDYTFDVVVQFVGYKPQHIENDIKIFAPKTKQYIFISSAAVYETPPTKLPIKESTPLKNPYWQYARDKIACENLLLKEGYENYFPITIVRPSHTYNETLIPFQGGYTVLDRMKKEKPVVVHGDGTSVWTMTHAKDFAKGLIGLFGNEVALVETYHITSDEIVTWHRIYEVFGQLLNVEPNLVYVPSNKIAQFDKEMGASLLGDKSHSMIFDNSKIKRLVLEFDPKISFEEGANQIVNYYNNPKNQIVDEKTNALFDKIINKYK